MGPAPPGWARTGSDGLASRVWRAARARWAHFHMRRVLNSASSLVEMKMAVAVAFALASSAGRRSESGTCFCARARTGRVWRPMSSPNGHRLVLFRCAPPSQIRACGRDETRAMHLGVSSTLARS
eukprot:2716480-Prymnesium_polylepis.1